MVDKDFVYKKKNGILQRQTCSGAPGQRQTTDRTMASIRIILLFVAIGVSSELPIKSHRGSHGHPIPPEPRFDGVFDHDHNHKEIGN